MKGLGIVDDTTVFGLDRFMLFSYAWESWCCLGKLGYIINRDQEKQATTSEAVMYCATIF